MRQRLFACGLWSALSLAGWVGHADQTGYTPVSIESSALFSKDVAVFYPENTNPDALPPSFALLSEPRPVGAVPASWKVRPRFESDGTSLRFTIPVAEGTSLYGTGEVVGPLERTGRQVTLWNTDNYLYKKDKGQRLYQSHPWILAVRRDGSSFGVLADTTYESHIDLRDDGIHFTSDAPGFRVMVIEKQSPQDVIMELGKLTGTMEMPPLWALGYQQCRFSYFPDKRVREIADTFREKKIPCDVIWVDIDYMDGFRIFTFDKNRFADPKATNGYLHDKGFKSVWMIDPGVKKDPNYFVYTSGSDRDVWVKDKQGKPYVGKVWPGACVFPDYTYPDVAAWWGDLYQDFLAQGIDGVWNDMNEPSVFNGPHFGTMPKENTHKGGRVLPNGGTLAPGSHAQYHNVYGMLMVMASRAGILKARPDKRPFLLTRSNYLGGQRYAATWTGDNQSTVEHMKMSVPMSLNLGLSGQPFSGPDAGGYGGKPEQDLMGHWFSLAAFYPFSRGHSERGRWHKEPWLFGEEVETATRISLERRYRLMPYFYTLFREASETGMPVMRPVFFADPADASLRKEDQVFLLGNDLLIVPKWAENPKLPAGYDRVVNLVGEDSTSDKYLCDMRIRNGAIIPVTGVMQSTAEFRHEDLSLLIRLDENGRASGRLYEDAGDGWAFKDGAYRETTFTAERKGNDVVIHIVESKGNFKIPARTLKVFLVTDSGMVEQRFRQSKTMTLTFGASVKSSMKRMKKEIG